MTSGCKLLVFLFACYFLSFFPSIHSTIHGKCFRDYNCRLPDDLYPMYMPLNWNESMDCCKWEGVECDGVGHAISLYLENKEISGEDWKSIFELQYLEVLDLPWNDFGGIAFPVELFNLTRLKYLNLSGSEFIGHIPIGFSKLTSLVTLDLSYSFKLQVKNPGVLFQNLTRLRQLYLNDLDISAPANAFSSLSKLQVLSLTFCQLSGPILPSLSNLTQLKQLYFQNVYISAGGTAWSNVFSSMSKLQVLSLRDCQLSGPILPSLSNLSAITTIHLDDNPLNTTILSHYFSNFTNLRTLTLQSTHLHGQFPENIFQMPTLEILVLKGNELLGGSLPRQFPKTGSLKEMIISFTNFSGSLPDSIGHLKALSKLDLLDSSFSGAIPSSLFALPSLQYLYLTNNYFDGEIEEFQIASSSSLVELDLTYNNFIKSIPKSLFYLKSLQYLDLSFNSFNGTLGLNMFNNFKNLTHLDISHNNLSIDASCSATSTCLSSFSQISELGLASCNLKMFPDLRNQSRMTYLDLSLNNITGKIPNWIWRIGSILSYQVNLSCNLLVGLQKPYHFPKSLKVLDLHANLLNDEIPVPRLGGWIPNYIDYSNNNFNTSIPSNIGQYMSYVKFFSLSHNNIQVDIPKSICNGTSLYVLDLSNNFLRGKIPECLFGIVYEDFGVLNLAGNKLGGDISDTFQHHCGLRTLDLSRNSLRGKIPKSLANCKSMQVFKVGNNYLEGNFPCTLMRFLSVLVLRFNMFHGEINCSWGIHSLPSLQILDVSHNNFSGALPPQLFLKCREMIVVDSTEAPPLQIDTTFGSVYQDTVKLVTKGLEVELVKILKIYMSLDFSCNHFQGNIPIAIGKLRTLYTLNLSHNALIGKIPRSFGKLEQLQSLDLSTNRLIGKVPSELGELTFLSVLNLSYNQLIGKIPDGRQMQTFSDSSFLGNKGLCGIPLNISCDHGLHYNGSSVSVGPFEKKGIEWEFVSAALGFSVGIGIILWMNCLNPAWWRRFNSLIIQFLFL